VVSAAALLSSLGRTGSACSFRKEGTVAHLLLSLLGPFQVTLAEEPITRFESNKVRALLAYLAVEAEQPHRREVLAALLWPEWPERAARAYLRNALSDLRQAIADHSASPPFLLISRSTIQLNLTSDCWVDVRAFRALLESEPADRTADRWLEEALSLYRGTFLEGFSLKDSPVFEDWALVVREQLERQASTALHQLAAKHVERGQYDRAGEYARRRVGLEPWNKGAHRQLMRALALSGQRSAALAQYEACRRALKKELDVEPGPETARLYQQIRDGALAAPRQEVHEQTGVSQRRHNLPASLTPLIGRRSELAQLEALLRDPACRLITFSGPGGSGKTRLALEVAAAQVGRYPDGVYWVGLAGVGAVEAIAPTVARELRLPLYGGEEPLRQLLHHLREKKMLLILDNYEQLLSGVGVVVSILERAAGVKVLATARGRLDVRGEQVYPVEGLDLPLPGEGLAEMAQRSAVQLFVASARRLQPAFELTQDNAAGIARICRLVEGMPLGILLAAAWIEMLAPDEIADQIERGFDVLEADWRGVPARQRSMRAVFGHSWSLLPEGQRGVMEALSVFRGGFTREAAQQVAGASLRDLLALIHRSLLHHTEDERYEIHELLRQFAAEKLCLSSTVDAAQNDRQGAAARGRECLTIPGRYCVALGERHCAVVRDRHCAYYAEFLAQKETDMVKGYIRETMREVDNVRVGWDWAAQRGKAAEILKSSLSLWLVHNSLNWIEEGAAAFGKAVDGLRGEAWGEPVETKDVALGFALGIQGHLVWRSGDTKRAAQLAQEALSVLDRYGTRRELAWCKFIAARYFSVQDEARRRLLEESLAISQNTDFHQGIVLALMGLERYQELLRVSREAGNRRGLALALKGLGDRAYARQGYAEARRFYEESLALAKEVSIEWCIGMLAANLGDVALAQGEHEAARQRYEEALAQATRVRYVPALLLARCGLARMALLVQDPVTAKRHYRHTLQIAVKGYTPSQWVREMDLELNAVVGIATLLAGTDKVLAVELAALARHHPSSTEEMKARAKDVLDSLRAGLSPAAFAAAEERGRSRDLETTLAELLVRFEAQDSPGVALSGEPGYLEGD
jgi:predicted ATPase/DNA-binding SARP family transcriptional activator